jgi:hypothetical protein
MQLLRKHCNAISHADAVAQTMHAFHKGQDTSKVMRSTCAQPRATARSRLSSYASAAAAAMAFLPWGAAALVAPAMADAIWAVRESSRKHSSAARMLVSEMEAPSTWGACGLGGFLAALSSRAFATCARHQAGAIPMSHIA